MHQLMNNNPNHTVAENNKHVFSHCFGGSEIWKQLNWVVLAWSLFKDCSQVSAGMTVGEGLTSLEKPQPTRPECRPGKPLALHEAA